jgi:hypothetical protein
MTTTTPPTTIPLSAGADRVDDWELGRTGAGRMPNVYRGFTGTLRVIDCAGP